VTAVVPEAARQAIRRGAWRDARRELEASLATGEAPEVLEHLGLVGWWLDDAALTFEARERAYQLYRDNNDPRGAARVALWLVWDNLAFRGDSAVSAGWLERARRLLDGYERSPEYGWLLMREAEVSLFRQHDPTTARTSARRAAQLGRETGDRALEFTALALEGLARVSSGDVAAGMRCLDEATAAATGGEVKELVTVGLVGCWQITACEMIRDYDRAAQWCTRVLEYSKRWGYRPLSAVCRTQFAGVLIWRGDWAAAEQELEGAARDMERVRPAMVAQVYARLGELRVRQGRHAEAATLFERASTHPLARIGYASLALERGAAGEAAAELKRFLDQIGDGESTLRAAALELAVRAQAAAADTAGASRSLEELKAIAKALGTDPLAASAAFAEAALRRAAGDWDGAIACAERAAALYQSSGAPYETARVQRELAELLAHQGEHPAAERLARAAATAFRELGATHDEARARQRREPAEPLTQRQVEILRLVARGMSNPEIAARLHLSDHTVKRHIANLLARLGLPSRAAAVAHAATQGLL
jgi:ATP/maltotriose-dependent transcriptional regulator MalT